MSPPPQINATLLAVSDHSGGFSEDYDRSSDPPTPRWQGSSGAYVQEKMRSVFDPAGALQRVTDIVVYIDDSVARSVSLKPGDSLTIQYLANTYVVRAQGVATPVLPGVAGYCKVALEELGDDQLATP